MYSVHFDQSLTIWNLTNIVTSSTLHFQSLLILALITSSSDLTLIRSILSTNSRINTPVLINRLGSASLALSPSLWNSDLTSSNHALGACLSPYSDLSS